MNIYLSGAITSDKNFKKKFKKVESIIRKKFKGAGVIIMDKNFKRYLLKSSSIMLKQIGLN